MRYLNMMLGKISKFPWLPLLFTIYAPLALLAHNLGQVEIQSGYRSLLLSATGALLFLVILGNLLRDWQKAGLIVTLLAILFFTYGRVYDVIKNVQIAGFIIGRHRYLAPIWLGLASLGVAWILKKIKYPSSLMNTLNIMSLILLAFPLMQTARFELLNSNNQPTSSPESPYQTSLPADRTLPDVYYVILDGYGRSDILLKNFNYDNSAFIDQLRQQGFYVATCSQSNYSKTDLSLASSLNFNYLDVLGDEFTPENTDRSPLWRLIKNSAVAAELKKMGYRIVAFETGFDFTQLANTDFFYFSPRRGFNEFESLLLKTSLAVILDDAGLFRKYHLTVEDRKRDNISYILAKLVELPALPGPKFVFAHLVIPHQPFVIGPNGEPVVVRKSGSTDAGYYTDIDYVNGYRDQAIYISNQIIPVVTRIVRDSRTPPVIIIQGDHGPSHFDEADRIGILNAYLFPQAHPGFYSTITPVNTFRLVFNTYFETQFDLLKDVTYYSTYPYAYQYQEILNECKGDGK